MALWQTETARGRGNQERQTLGVGLRLRERLDLRHRTAYGGVDHVKEL